MVNLSAPSLSLPPSLCSFFIDSSMCMCSYTPNFTIYSIPWLTKTQRKTDAPVLLNKALPADGFTVMAELLFILVLPQTQFVLRFVHQLARVNRTEPSSGRDYSPPNRAEQSIKQSWDRALHGDLVCLCCDDYCFIVYGVLGRCCIFLTKSHAKFHVTAQNKILCFIRSKKLSNAV